MERRYTRAVIPMPMMESALRRKAFEFVEQVNKLSTAAEVMDAMDRVLGRHGFEFFCFNTFPRPQQRFDEVMLAVRVPPEWIKLYIQKNYVHVDPTIRLCRRTVHPFEWRDAPYNPDAELPAAEMVQRATDFGLSNGFWVPIPGPTGCVGGVWLGGARPDFSARTKSMMHIMALYAFDRVRQLASSARQPRPILTAREREILTWVGSGKSAWEIGEILHIAKRTVDDHVQKSCQKLDAVTRTQAVAIALRERLIEI